MNNKRVQGRIIDVSHGIEPDHGHMTCSIGIEFTHGRYQSFGNLVLDDDLLKSFLDDLCFTFNVETPEDLMGKEVYALRCFGYNNDHIEGLETISGKRMTLTSWRKKHFSETLSPLDNEIKKLSSRIEQAQNSISRAIADLSKVQSEYTDWG